MDIARGLVKFVAKAVRQYWVCWLMLCGILNASETGPFLVPHTKFFSFNNT